MGSSRKASPWALAALAAVGSLPGPVRGVVGSFTGAMAYHFARRRRQIAARNIELCFPEKTPAQRAQLLNAHFRLLGRSIIDRLALLAGDERRLRRMVELRGVEHWERLQGEPIIVFAPHFLGLDLGGIRVAFESNLGAFYRPQHNPVADAVLLRIRSRFQSADAPLFKPSDSLKSMCRFVRAGNPLYYLPDVDLKGRGEHDFVPLLGVEHVATTRALPRLASLCHARVIPCVTTMLRYGKYALTFYPPWEGYPSGDHEADALRMNRFIEQRIMETPEQYHWLHRRFKTRPEGQPSLYEDV